MPEERSPCNNHRRISVEKPDVGVDTVTPDINYLSMENVKSKCE